MTAIKNYMEYIVSALVGLGAKIDCTHAWQDLYARSDVADSYVRICGKALARVNTDITLSDKIIQGLFDITDTVGDEAKYCFVTSIIGEGAVDCYLGSCLPEIFRDNEPDEDGFIYVLKEVSIFGKARLHCQRDYYYDDDTNTEGYYTDERCTFHNVIFVEFTQERVNGRFGRKSDTEVMAENKPDDLLQTAVYATGIAAFIGRRTMEEISQDLLHWFNNYKEFGDVCCAWKDQTLGPVGFYVSGKVNLASNMDLWSWRDADSIRHFDPRDERAEDGIICRKEELDFTLHSHCEFFVKPQRIRGVWITANFAGRNPEFVRWAEDVAHRNGVKLFIVRNRS